MKPIPKRLLIHTVMYQKETASDFWRENVKVTDVQELKHVRMEASSKIVRDKNTAEIQLAATLFYDCRNSKPKGIVFAIDDIIIFNGQKHCVKAMESLYDDKRLHHYEVGLVKYA